MKYFGKIISSSDVAGTYPTIVQPVDFDKPYLIKAVRTWIVLYNSPVFTALQFKMFSSAQLLHTFDTNWAFAQLSPDANAAREIYFDLAKPISVAAGRYYFAPWLTGYAGNDSSHVAWVKGFPDPVNSTGVGPINLATIGSLPYKIGFIGSPL